jgi:hypothetical protein
VENQKEDIKMIGMQYKITLPSDYNMELIKTRVSENGFKTDGFEDVLFKCYLIKEKGVNGFENLYAPLYVWKSNIGMNKFLFDGYYDNIINSFGWQNVNIGIPILIELTDNFNTSNYAIEVTNEISSGITLTSFRNSVSSSSIKDKNYTGRVCIYNPDKWKYSMFYFYKEYPDTANDTFQILHISE